MYKAKLTCLLEVFNYCICIHLFAVFAALNKMFGIYKSFRRKEKRNEAYKNLFYQLTSNSNSV